MEKYLYDNLKYILENEATIIFELYDLGLSYENPRLEIIGGNDIEVDLDELQEELIYYVFYIINNYDFEENTDIGLRIQPRLDQNGDLEFFYESVIDDIFHGNIDYLFDFNFELENLETENLFDFLPNNYNKNNYTLSAKIIYKNSELNVHKFELIYSDGNQKILIKNKVLLDTILMKIENSIINTSWVMSVYPKYVSSLEILIEIANNQTVTFKEYYNKRRLIPEAE